MAVLKIEYNDGEFSWMRKIQEMMPEMNSSFLGYVGYKSKNILKAELLSGQKIQMRKGYKNRGKIWTDTTGRRKASYAVKWNSRVTISSYPANLFTKGRELRNGKRTTPIDIFGPLGQKVDSRMSVMSKDFDSKIFQKKISLIMGQATKKG